MMNHTPSGAKSITKVPNQKVATWPKFNCSICQGCSWCFSAQICTIQ